jgi:hypothetical protein
MSEFKKGQILSNGYIIGKGRTPLNLTEKQIRYAMKNSKSNAEASRFLNVSISTYWKYSRQHIDEETGETLWAVHSNKTGKGVNRSYVNSKYNLNDILDGKHPEYPLYKLKKRLIKNSKVVNFPHKCHNCGYDEKRIIDNVMPLVLDHMDDDWKNHKRDNMRFLCYNCYHNLKGNLRGGQPKWRMEQVAQAKARIKAESAKESNE